MSLDCQVCSIRVVEPSSSTSLRRLAEGREGEGEDGVDEDVDVDVDVDEGLQAEGGEATKKLRDGERQGEAHIKGG